MLLYLEAFVVAFFFSSLFATGGVGSAIVLIPMLSMMGIGFDLAKAAGLMVNTISTSTASVINFRHGLLDVRQTLPFLLASMAAAPVGAYCAKGFNTQLVKMLFAVFLFISAYMMVQKASSSHRTRNLQGTKWLMYPLGVVVGFFAGLLGIGGGAFIIPALFYMQYAPKKIASTVSFMIPLSTFVAFLSYVILVDIDWVLIMVVSVSAVLGGNVGTAVMHRYLGDVQMKKFLAAILFLIGLKMIHDIL